jgi:catechol 2,3-dioxygenase-like lactoylglutathione lyase family enzyme
MTYRYHHLHLLCSNLENMEDFFTQMLGAKLIERRKFGKVDGAVLDLNGITISLKAAHEDDTVVGDSSQQRYGYDHLGLEVGDIDAAYEELRGKGLTFSVPPTKVENGKMAFFKGPDGITIELFQSLR